MLILTAAVTHGTNPSEVVFLITAIAIAAFWRALIKIGIAILVLGILVLAFESGSALIAGLHAIIP